jgi:polyisoprenoid-binding protein YceI
MPVPIHPENMRHFPTVPALSSQHLGFSKTTQTGGSMKVGMLVVAMIAGAAGTAAAQGPSPRMPLESSATLWFDGTSTVRGFKCSAKSINASIVTNAPDVAAATIGDLVDKAAVAIPVSGLDCGNGTMNEHMRKALNAEKYPEIKFVMTGYDVAGVSATIKGLLTIAGKENSIEIPANVSPDVGGVRVRATKVIDMTQWGVKPPSLMMGTMKVKPVVSVGFDVLVKR